MYWLCISVCVVIGLFHGIWGAVFKSFMIRFFIILVFGGTIIKISQTSLVFIWLCPCFLIWYVKMPKCIENGDNCVPACTFCVSSFEFITPFFAAYNSIKHNSFNFLHCVLLSNAIDSTLSYVSSCPIDFLYLNSAFFLYFFDTSFFFSLYHCAFNKLQLV